MFENFYVQWFVAAILLIVIDLVWLYLMKDFYMTRLNAVGSTTLRLWPVVLLYVLMGLGIIVFVLPYKSIWYGALFGLVGYAIYDLTNYALFSKWALEVVAIDMFWGAALNGLVTYILLLLTNS